MGTKSADKRSRLTGGVALAVRPFFCAAGYASAIQLVRGILIAVIDMALSMEGPFVRLRPQETWLSLRTSLIRIEDRYGTNSRLGICTSKSRRAVPTDRFCLHAGACASACPARESAIEGQSTAGQNDAACIETDTRENKGVMWPDLILWSFLFFLTSPMTRAAVALLRKHTARQEPRPP